MRDSQRVNACASDVASRRTVRIALAVAVSFGATACRTSTAAGDGSTVSVPSSALVYGTVTRPDGSPLAGWSVRSRAYAGTCLNDPRQGVGGGTPTYVPTDVLGRYRQTIVAVNGMPFTACIEVAVVPNVSQDTVAVAQVGGASVRFQTVPFRSEANGSAASSTIPLDSVRVDVRVP